MLASILAPIVVKRRLAAPGRKTGVLACVKKDGVGIYHLEAINARWRHAREHVPYYRELAASGVIPKVFSSLGEYARKMPALTKNTIQAAGHELADPSRRVVCWRKTGGSTSQPVSLPISSREILLAEENEWYFRSLIGVTALDRQLRIWGHAHLLGGGIRARLNGAIRRVKDDMLGITRFSAYKLSEAHIRQALEKMSTIAGDYLFGYSRALELYAEQLLLNPALAGRFSHLKAIIATSESFSTDAARESVERAFQVPVFMEYGCVETGPIAQSAGDGFYHVAYDAFYLEVLPDDQGRGRILLTALTERALPLFRYEIGDLLQGWDSEEGCTQFKAVAGRSNDYILLQDGTRLHSEVVSHAIRGFDFVCQYQIVIEEGVQPVLHLICRGELTADKIDSIRRSLTSLSPALVGIGIKKCNALRRTVAGKTPMVYRIL